MLDRLPGPILLLALAACGHVGGAPSNPFVPETRYVAAVAVRGAYIDATLSGRGRPLRFLFPTSETCAAILRPEAEVRYSARGRYGQLNNPVAGGDPCIPLGVGSLRVWRDKGPRPQPAAGATGSPLPRRTARFAVIWEDEAEIFLRGEFPLASWIGMAPANDLVAVVPNTEACRKALAGGQATLEYRFTGKDPYTLMMAPPDRCAVAAFAIPPTGAR